MRPWLSGGGGGGGGRAGAYLRAGGAGGGGGCVGTIGAGGDGDGDGIGGAVPRRRFSMLFLALVKSFLVPFLALATTFLMFEANGAMVEEWRLVVERVGGEWLAAFEES